MNKQGPSSDEVYQGELRRRARVQEDQERRDYLEIMALPAGRRFMYSLVFIDCDLMSTYGGADIGIHRHEGRRSVGQDLVKRLQTICPSSYITMVAERMMEDENERKLREVNEIDRKRRGDEDA